MINVKTAKLNARKTCANNARASIQNVKKIVSDKIAAASKAGVFSITHTFEKNHIFCNLINEQVQIEAERNGFTVDSVDNHTISIGWK
jgi:hypothetical protein